MSFPLNPSGSAEQSTLSIWKDKDTSYCETIAEKVEAFIQKHFALILFSASCLAFAIATPSALVVGTVAGGILNWCFNPDLHLAEQDRVVTVTNTLFTMVGAIAALIQFAPSGQAGGFIYNSIPWLASLAVGSTGYRAVCQLFRND